MLTLIADHRPTATHLIDRYLIDLYLGVAGRYPAVSPFQIRTKAD